VFSKFKSLNISLEEGRKALTFDLKGGLLHLANVRPEINSLRSFTYMYDLLLSIKTRFNYDTVG